MEMLALSISKRGGVDLFIHGVDVRNGWSQFVVHLAWAASIIIPFLIYNIKCMGERKSTPRDLTSKPVAGILGGKGVEHSLEKPRRTTSCPA
eukprot:7693753-Heterocapsa_arctica.AAC.1